MILYVSSIIMFLFVSFTLFFRTDCALWIKIVGIALIALASFKYVIYQFLGGAFFAPHMPREAIIFMEAMYGSLIILFFLLILWDIYLAGNWMLGRMGMPLPRHLPTGWIRCGLCLLALCLGGWATWQAIKVPAARRIEVHLANLPRQLDGFRLLQLTDLHIGPVLQKNWLDLVVDKSNALDADLIVMTGDYVDGHVNEILHELEPLRRLKAKYGVLAVTGNHEYYWNAREWVKALEEMGIRMLENEHVTLNIQGNPLVVAGVPDLAAERFGETLPDVKQALRDAPKAVKILLSHQPRNAESYLEQADLQLSGHTHGGHLFFLQPLIARFNSGFVAGAYKLGEKILYVSSGTGLWNGFSSRLGVPAEITLMILRTAPVQSANED